MPTRRQRKPTGWSAPYFERGAAEAILIRSVQVGFRWRYDYESDAYIVTHAAFGEGTGPEVFAGMETALEGSSIKLYPIGAPFWAWRQAER